MSIPRALHVASLSFIGLLLAGVLVLGIPGAYYVATSSEPLAVVPLVFASVLAVPLLLAGALWVAGYAVRFRAPRTAVGLVVGSAAVGGAITLLAAWFFLGSVLV